MGQGLGCSSGSQSDVTCGLQSSENLTGAKASTRIAGKMVPLYGGLSKELLESPHKMAVGYPEQAIQETKMHVAVALMPTLRSHIP